MVVGGSSSAAAWGNIALPQVLLCILAVVAIFIFILATIICCLLRFVGPDGVYYKLDSDKTPLDLEEDEATFAEENAKPTLIYQTMDDSKDNDSGVSKQLDETEAFFDMKNSCKLWRSWNSQVHNIALPKGNSAETQL